ncbi:MAG: hypothetical protein QGH41_01890, partial [Roseibacillus sp.]|nr:hypothetical protein [Roseibacillus sp.]
MAFVELVAVGVALALRTTPGDSPAVVERVVTEYVPITLPAGEPESTVPVPTPTPSLPIPEAFTNAEIAAMASEAIGKPITVVNLTDEQLAEGMKAAGVPAPM